MHGQWSSRNKKGTRPVLILATWHHTAESGRMTRITSKIGALTRISLSIDLKRLSTPGHGETGHIYMMQVVYDLKSVGALEIEFIAPIPEQIATTTHLFQLSECISEMRCNL